MQLQDVTYDTPMVFHNLPSTQYHSGSGLSSSNLKALNKSVLHYIHLKETPKVSDPLEFGSMFHDCILLPDEFEKKYAKGPENAPRNTKDGKEKWAVFEASNQGKTIVKSEDYDKCIEMRDRLLSIDAVKFIFNAGKPEVSYYWTDEESGVLCKCRPDWIREDDAIVVDLKTTRDNCNRNAFAKDVVDWGYDLSAAFYLDGLSQFYKREFKTFTYIVIEKQPPYDVGLYVLGKDSIDVGRKLYRRAIDRYLEYMKAPVKKLYDPKEFELIDLPEWAKDITRR